MIDRNIQYRTVLCKNQSDLTSAGKIRYACYREANAIAFSEEALFLDDYDRKANSRSCVLYRNDVLAGAIRASLYAPDLGFLSIPSMEVYSAEIAENVGLDSTIVESNRFVVLPGISDSRIAFKQLFRFIFLNVFKSQAHYVVTAVRPEHVRFYRRLMMYPVSDPKKYPGIEVQMVLLAADCRRDLKNFIDRNTEYGPGIEELKEYPEWKSNPNML